MFSATFIVEDGYQGEFSVTPAEGYENDMPVTLTAEIVGEDGETDDDTEDEETIEDTDDTSDDDIDNTDDKTDTTQDNDTSDKDNNVSADTDEDEDVNPETGITVSVAAIDVAGAAFFAAFKCKKKQK